MKSQPLVSVVIPTHNRKTMLSRLLKSIITQTYKNLEVIVIDDYSTDGTFEFIKLKYENIKKIKLIRNKKNLFTAATRNIGIKNSKGEFIFFVDDDNVLDKNLVLELTKTISSDDQIGEVGPVNYNFNNKKKILWLRTERNMITTKTTQPRIFGNLSGKKSWESVDIPNAFMVRASILRRHKIAFKEVFEIMYEESDLAYRIRNLGFKVIVVKSAKIYHDIENRKKGEPVKDYMYHFMENKRRPYVTARNRIIFHSIYSSKLELIFILLFWIWLFAGYYSYKILFYSGVGKFTFINRLNLVFYYLKGNWDGIRAAIE